MAEQITEPRKTDRQEILWRAIRRALMLIIRAIDDCYPDAKRSDR